MLDKNFLKKSIISFLKFKIFFLLLFNAKIVYSSDSINSLEKIPSDHKFIVKNNEKIKPEEYILGPGDLVYLNFLAIPEFSKNYLIMPDGFIYLPEISRFNAEGLTLEELVKELQYKYEPFLIKPKINALIVDYRPVRVYITGEVNRPGFYTLFIAQSQPNQLENINPRSQNTKFNQLVSGKKESINTSTLNNSIGIRGYTFPTLYDAISSSRGVTPNSDLSNIEVVRKMSKKNQYKKIKTKINFIPLITEGDLSQNIRIFDGDSIKISKSTKIIKDQISLARNSNLNPSELTVYITGNVEYPGAVSVPQGSGLNQAVAMAGGEKILSGNVEFIRFDNYGNPDKRKFKFNKENKKNSYKNPILIDGDIIHINKSLIGTTSSALSKITSPVVGVYTLLNIFSDD